MRGRDLVAPLLGGFGGGIAAGVLGADTIAAGALAGGLAGVVLAFGIAVVGAVRIVRG